MNHDWQWLFGVFVLLPVAAFLVLRLVRKTRRNYYLSRAYTKTRETVCANVYNRAFRGATVNKYTRRFTDNPNFIPGIDSPCATVRARSYFHAARKGFHPERLGPGVFWVFVHCEDRKRDIWRKFRVTVEEGDKHWDWRMDYA